MTGRLASIPEANENISSGADRGIGPEITRAGGISSITSNLASGPHTSAPAPPADTSSTKLEENRVASLPTTLSTAASVVDPFRSRVEVQVPGERHAGPEPGINDIPVPRDQAATSILESKEAFMTSPDIAESTTKIVDRPAQEPLGKLSTGGDSDEVDAANHETSSSVEGDTVLNADDVSTPTQPPTESSTDLPSEKPFETKSVVAESMDIKQTIEVAPRAPLIVDVEEDQATEEGPNDDKTSRIDSFHDTNAIADTRDTSITTVVTTPTLDTVENSPVQEAAASINDEVPAELPESPPASIAYATDLLEPFSPAASTPANAQSTENEMLLTSMQSDDFDFSETNDTKPIEEVADTKPIIPADIEEKPTTASITAAIDAVEAHASPSETPAPAAALEEVWLALNIHPH